MADDKTKQADSTVVDDTVKENIVEDTPIDDKIVEVDTNPFETETSVSDNTYNLVGFGSVIDVGTNEYQPDDEDDIKFAEENDLLVDTSSNTLYILTDGSWSIFTPETTINVKRFDGQTGADTRKLNKVCDKFQFV